jgi:L-threonylcarbamoyladenylate synthase
MSFPTSEQIGRAAELLRGGGIVAIPTETVYGLAANALDERAVRRIYEVKGRPSTSPLIVHVDSTAMARELASTWPDVAESLAQRFWPGPLTMVLPKRRHVPDLVTAGLPSVGLRMPSHAVALAVIRAAGIPLAAPSANRFTELSPTMAEHVRRGLGDRVDMILDGGRCEVGLESTVVSLTGARPVLLRPGMIAATRLEEVAGPLDPFARTADGADPSPGLQARHYSPRTPLLLLGAGEAAPPGRGERVTMASMPAAPAGYAAALYETLHRLDALDLDWIAVEPPPRGAEWAAIHDRLNRAASARAR